MRGGDFGAGRRVGHPRGLRGGRALQRHRQSLLLPRPQTTREKYHRTKTSRKFTKYFYVIFSNQKS